MDADTILKYKTGMMLGTIIMTGVTVGQLITTDFIVKGSPILSAVYTSGFLLSFLIMKAFEMNVHKMNIPEFAHWIYVNAEHIAKYHTKTPFRIVIFFGIVSCIGGYVITRSITFAAVAFVFGVLSAYALFEAE